MGSLRTPGTGETVASNVQPSTYRNEGETVQSVGTQLWDGTGWVPAAQALNSSAPQPHAGMLAVVPQVMNTAGLFAPMENAEAVPDNSKGQNIGETAIGLCNQEGNFDQQRNNTYDQIALASQARTASATSTVQTNYNFSKIFIRLVETGPVGTGTLQVTIGSNIGVLAEFVPITPSGEGNIHWFEAAPGLANAAEGGAVTTAPKVYAQTANVFIPRDFTLGVIHSDSSSWTYELLYALTL